MLNDAKRNSRFSLRTLFWLQLIILPAFLYPVYRRRDDGQFLQVMLLEMIVPLLYVAILVVRQLRRAEQAGKFPRESVVRYSLKCGVLFALLFAILAKGLFAIELLLGRLQALSRFRAPSVQWDALAYEVLAVGVGVPLCVGLLYGLAGAGIGGVVGLIYDRCTSDEPAPAAGS